MGEGEAVVLHSQSSMAHYPASQFQPITHDVDYSQSRSVLRGFAEIDHVEQGLVSPSPPSSPTNSFTSVMVSFSWSK